MDLHVDHDLDYLYLGDSDVEKAESSEDEIDILLNGTPEQRRRLRRNSKTRAETPGKQRRRLRRNSKTRAETPGKQRQQSDSDSEDDFEKTLNAELDERVSALERSRHGGSAGQQASATLGKKAAEAFYDDIYFDSDEEQENQEQKQKRKVISNDDLLYDPDMDDEDERWVQHQINSHQMRQASRLAGATKSRGKKGVSDAKLDCPACMTTLCLDCQRHEVYKHQYRAMFVMNCTVDTTQTLHYPVPEEKKKKKKQRRQQAEQQAVEVEGEAMQAEQGEPIPEPGTSGGQEDLYNPVKCQECGTVVGVYDSDEVYHFFNILASYS